MFAETKNQMKESEELSNFTLKYDGMLWLSYDTYQFPIFFLPSQLALLFEQEGTGINKPVEDDGDVKFQFNKAIICIEPTYYPVEYYYNEEGNCVRITKCHAKVKEK